MKFEPSVFLALMRQCGFYLTREDGRLMVEPLSKLTPEMQDAIRRHKAELLLHAPEDRP